MVRSRRVFDRLQRDVDRRREEIAAFNAAHPDTRRALAVTPVKFGISFNVTAFNQAGALPGPALEQVVDAVKKLDMEEVHAQVAKLQAEHGEHADH